MKAEYEEPPGGTPGKASHFHACTLAALVVTGAVTRLIFLFQPIRFDEVTTFYDFAIQPFAVGLTHYPYPNNHLLLTFLDRLIIRYVSDAAWAIRLPDFLAGVLLVPALYVLFKRLYGERAGLFAAALAAFNPLLVSQSVQARGYSLQALIVVLLVIVAVDLKRKPSAGGWTWFVVLTVLGFYDMPTMVYFIGPVAAWLFISALVGDVPGARTRFIGALAGSLTVAGLLTFLLYLPVISKVGVGYLVNNPQTRAFPLSWLPRMMSGIGVSSWRAVNLDLGPLLPAVVLFGFVVALVLHGRLSSDRVNLPLIAFAWYLLVVLAMRVPPPLRAILPLVALYLGFAGAGLDYAARRAGMAYRRLSFRRGSWSPGTACVLLVAVTLFFASLVVAGASPYATLEDGARDPSLFRVGPEVAGALEGLLLPGDIVYTPPISIWPLEYDFAMNGVPFDYLYGNMHAAQPVSLASVNRVIVVESFTERHTLDWAVRGTPAEALDFSEPSEAITSDEYRILVFDLREGGGTGGP
ncbi:MAG: glycosyltransferase family 39 protein [Actinomycetota bacterium]